MQPTVHWLNFSAYQQISGEQNMQAVLKGLHSIDIADLENYAPHEEDNFGFVLQR